MIYLVRSFLRDGQSIYKIGYSDNIDSRKRAYYYHNPGMEFISIREGDELVETGMHYYMKLLGKPYRGFNEWFIIDYQDVLRIFHSSQDRIDRINWGSRDKLFSDQFRGLSILDNSYLAYLFSKFDTGNIKDLYLSGIREDSVTYRFIKHKRSEIISSLDISEELDAILVKFDSFSNFIDKMKFVCNTGLNEEMQDKFLRLIPMQFECYYKVFGPERIKTLKYRNDLLKSEYEKLINKQNNEIDQEIYNTFLINEKYSRPFIKSKLKEIYEKSGYKKTAKASDLEEYFKLVRCNILNSETGKLDNGFKIIAKKTE